MDPPPLKMLTNTAPTKKPTMSCNIAAFAGFACVKRREREFVLKVRVKPPIPFSAFDFSFFGTKRAVEREIKKKISPGARI